MTELTTTALAARLEEVEAQLEFIMLSQQLTLNIPTGVLDARGQQQMTQISGPLKSFYLKARANGKHSLAELAVTDFRDVLDAAGKPHLAV